LIRLFLPFQYDDEEFPDLVQFSRPNMAIRTVSCRSGRGFLDSRPNANLRYSQRHDPRHPRAFSYQRQRAGTQHPLDTLQTGSGTCRDYALFMIEALRRLGIAARFVSGYLFIPATARNGYVGGGSTHLGGILVRHG